MWEVIKTIIKGALISLLISSIAISPALLYLYFYQIGFLYIYLVLFTLLSYYWLGKMFTKKKLDHTDYDRIRELIRYELCVFYNKCNVILLPYPVIRYFSVIHVF